MAIFIFNLQIPLRVFRCKNAKSIEPNSDFTRFYPLASGYKRLAAPNSPHRIYTSAKIMFSKPVFQICLFLIRERKVMNGTVTISPTCLTCGKPLRGRTDKKFCDAGCKNEHNNRLQREEREAVKSIDRILKHNRRLLKRKLGERATRLASTKGLLHAGFRFDYHTHQFANEQSDLYVFCYDYGYLALDDGRCLIVKSRGGDAFTL
jgi:hypothetical protein